MYTTRTRKQGNSIVVTLPASEEYPIASQKEYFVFYHEDGTVTLVPKIDNPFLIAEEGAYYDSEVWEDMPRAGEELL
ncbi:AbrB family transcriptional regulator [Suicoccus acidiformans]|uniref:AbrB family transcriptional regulator n=1 Tax=Suicoccus acidiformans TaxID=2036206 RepID=A0A347WMA3_9LACT|nr:AbrB family transcriptional regulator [Suicoccus acidiformans]AXY26210.1 AbrB family transcriptional regulator [Suicoccus acidiformans]